MDTQNSSFSFKKNEVDDKTVLSITLKGKRSDWEPDLKAALDAEDVNRPLHEAVTKAVASFPDVLEKSHTLELTFRKPVDPENVITSIGQIPEVMEGIDQPSLYLTGEVGERTREVVLLGETHLATEKESRAASRIIPFFDSVGYEGVDVRGCIEGKIFFFVMGTLMFPLLWIMSLGKRSKKHTSSITQANYLPAKKSVWLERGWHPTYRARLFFLTFSAFFIYALYNLVQGGVQAASDDGSVGLGGYLLVAIIGLLLVKVKFISKITGFFIDIVINYGFGFQRSRDKNMAKNLVEALRGDETIGTMLVTTGADHTPTIAKILQKKYGFEEKPFPAA